MTTLAFNVGDFIEFGIVLVVMFGGAIASWSKKRRAEIARQEREARARAGLDPTTGDLPTSRDAPIALPDDDDESTPAAPRPTDVSRGMTLEELRQRALAKIEAERRAAGLPARTQRPTAPTPQRPAPTGQPSRAAERAAARARQIEQMRQRQAAIAAQQRQQAQQARSRAQQEAARRAPARPPTLMPPRPADDPVLVPVDAPSPPAGMISSPPALGAQPAPPADPRKRAIALGLVANDRNALRRAFIYSEIFGPAVGDR